MQLGEKTAFRIKRLVAITCIGVCDHRVNDHLVAVLIDAGGIASEDHGEPIGSETDSLQAPEIVMVERRGANVHPHPTGRA
jgi:hypothetical protein